MGLLTLAALIPKEWNIKLVDHQVRRTTEEELRWCDLVFVGGMAGQTEDCLEIIAKAKRMGKKVVVGGPGASFQPDLFSSADHLVLKEAEVNFPEFISDLEMGAVKKIYSSSVRAAMTLSPLPRYDLISINDYLKAQIEISRGCPFVCEFCTSIVANGRIPRVKSVKQVIDELEQIYLLGHRGLVDFVDDNLVGGFWEVRPVLKAVAEWQRGKGYPFRFFSMLSANAASDKEMLQLLSSCGFHSVFIGFESTDAVVLRHMKKIQNLPLSISEMTKRFYEVGVRVSGGFILGSDGEDGGTAKRILKMLAEAGIPRFSLSLLSVDNQSKLSSRLEQENRLIPKGKEFFAGNFVPSRSRYQVVEDFKKVLLEAYSPQEYFNRVLKLAVRLNVPRQLDSRSQQGAARRISGSDQLRKSISLIKSLSRYPGHLFYFLYTSLRCLFVKPNALAVVGEYAALLLDEIPSVRSAVSNARYQNS